ncbi:MAG: TIGR03619 family F420-dependent LLM class oxidoreductase [Alphaproteobacteria bacterium]|nr:TIGR03619 family F420-dependent LLM class oxidoreductase [Alphaproteobacteria bacterium]
MQFGFGAPVSGPLCGPRDLARIVSDGEAIGYDYCTVSDHVVIPRELEAKYPYSDTGEFPGRAGGDRHEQMTAVTFVAAKTSKLRIVTSVTVVPHRPPVLTAKTLATIDFLSEGRITWGIGVGWCREEFEAIGTEPFEERGAVTDETIAVVREMWRNDNPRYSGKYAEFSNIFFEPRSVQKRLPIWVGGESGPALRRTAKLGDAWYPIGTNPKMRLDTLPRFETAVERLRKLTRDAGRDPKEVGLSYRFTQLGAALPDKADNGDRRLGSGSNEAIIGDLRALEELGVGAVDFNIGGDTAEAVIANMRRFREEVLAKV